MLGATFHQPDAETMQRLLKDHYEDTTGIVLRLAWCEGLTREEMSSLTWEQVDFKSGEIKLKSRNVPLEEETAKCLSHWKERWRGKNPYVVISVKSKDRLAPQSLSRLARFALDEVGQNSIRLEDLRFDFVRRQFLEHNWPYALRVSGMSVTTYRNVLAQFVPQAPDEIVVRDAKSEEIQLRQLLESKKETPAGIALWLSTQAGIRVNEIIALTWDQIDFDRGQLRLPECEVSLSPDVVEILRSELDRRVPGEDQHVILTPRTRKPMSAARLSTLVRDALVRSGIDNESLRGLRKETKQENERAKLLHYTEEHGSISRSEAVNLLGTSGGVAYSRLNDLVFDGLLERVNARYYLAGSAIAPQDQTNAILDYTALWGKVTSAEIANLLHIGKRTTERILKRMVARGELRYLRDEKRYELPKSSKS